MDFFDDVKRFGKNIGKNIGEKGKDVLENTKEVIEITKLNSQIDAQNDKTKELYSKIGEAVYKSHVYGQPASYDDMVLEIKEIEEIIKGINAKILAIKDASRCLDCGGEISKDTRFCPSCGVKVND